MKYDEIIDCPKSGGDLCYKMEINENITNFFSLSCGFWTNTLMIPGENFYEEQMSSLPELYKDLSWTDPKTGLVWVPNTVNESELGMVFANGVDKDNWSWSAVKAIEVEEKEKIKYPIPGKPGEYYKHRMDMENLKSFEPERGYIDALSYIGVLPE
jgi:pyruvate-formate lyase-activating enzyme